MGAWSKLFSDKNIVTSTVSVKGSDGVNRSAKLFLGASGLSDAEFHAAALAGSATLTESRKDVNATGQEVNKKNTIKAGDISLKQAGDAVAELLGIPAAPPAPPADPKPNKTQRGAAQPA